LQEMDCTETDELWRLIVVTGALGKASISASMSVQEPEGDFRLDPWRDMLLHGNSTAADH